MKYRYLAIGWFCFIVVMTLSVSEFVQEALVEPFLFGAKVKCIFVMAFTMSIAYLAGKEK